MAVPLAPTDQGSIVPSDTHVVVSGALAGARVSVLLAPSAQVVGERTAGADGGLLVPLASSPAVGRLVFAQQHRDGQSSSPSNVRGAGGSAGRPVTPGGSPVGVTGTAFGWTAPSSGTSAGGTSAGGTVAGSNAGPRSPSPEPRRWRWCHRRPGQAVREGRPLGVA